jgi:hypothetical protein
MSHELWPKADRVPLPVDEIIRRLRDSFAHVEVDVEEASNHLEEEIRHMLRMVGEHRPSSEEVERVRRSIGRAVYVVLADGPATDGTYLSFFSSRSTSASSSATSRAGTKRRRANCGSGWRESSTTTWNLSDRMRGAVIGKTG